MSKSLKGFMLVTDIGFIVYWLVTFLGILPAEYLYKDYTNEIMMAWNISFVPLDLFISATGLWSMYLYHKKKDIWSAMCIVSLSLTFCSGLQAIAFWGLRYDFDVSWWIPNLFLLIYPLFYLPALIRRSTYAGI
jgi:hypothetical protein